MKIYHNPRCSKSRLGLQFLQEKGVVIDVIEYLNQPFQKKELVDILKKLGMSPMELIRKGEDVYLEKIKGKTLTDDELISLMIENPKLIERPIVVNGDKAVVARPAEKITEIL